MDSLKDPEDHQSNRFRILVFGGSSQIGQCVIKKAIEEGMHVTALVRQPYKIQTRHKHLRIVLGDVFRDDSLKLATDEHCDAVISCLGKFSWPFQDPIDFYTKSMMRIVQIMKMRGFKRLITVTSWCLREDPNYIWYMKWFVKPLYNGAVLRSMAEMEDFLETTDPEVINYTIVRPTILTDDPPQGAFKIVEDCEYILDGEGTISKKDVAEFMFKLAQRNEHSRKAVAIANPRPVKTENSSDDK